MAGNNEAGGAAATWRDWLDSRIEDGTSWLGKTGKLGLGGLDDSVVWSETAFELKAGMSQGLGMALVADSSGKVSFVHDLTLVQLEGKGEVIGVMGDRRTSRFVWLERAERSGKQELSGTSRTPVPARAPARESFANVTSAKAFKALKGGTGTDEVLKLANVKNTWTNSFWVHPKLLPCLTSTTLPAEEVGLKIIMKFGVAPVVGEDSDESSDNGGVDEVEADPEGEADWRAQKDIPKYGS